MADVDVSSIYTLTNSYTGVLQVLTSSLNDDQIMMTEAGGASNKQWVFSVTSLADHYRMHTVQNGQGQSLDVLNDNGVDSIKLRFTSTADVSGQFWRFDLWDDGTLRLSNNFTGPDMHLDVYSDTFEPHLADGSASGQHWTLQRLGSISSTTESAQTSMVSTSSAATSVLTKSTATSAAPGISSLPPGSSSVSNAPSSTVAVSSSTPSASANAVNSSLSSGAIAGISVGAVGVVALCVASVLLILLLRKRRKRPTTQAADVQDSSQPRRGEPYPSQGPFEAPNEKTGPVAQEMPSPPYGSASIYYPAELDGIQHGYQSRAELHDYQR
ncbi:uncharacterized protein A1O9_01523 [Exophiala aquamarina CBS 119918]|uniref:Ricin B lectin domain-containing protein n=1 Tax=Exophiala aquamarina CBS 119918 TaxID=1182545 RepID=A0A072Q6J0_9EURO|nr:uncharacterized protein A1O9_01523 [Exophiala aquamarina CBS 119918]KEF63545.1 hypothetical protein A1O9_01523 [Exophiala aquamarina CBS 119918]